MKKMRWLAILLAVMLLTACAKQDAAPSATPQASEWETEMESAWLLTEKVSGDRKWVYEYNDQGDLICQTEYEDAVAKSWTEYTYDGRRPTLAVYYIRGMEENRTKYTYDGDTVRTVTYDSEDPIDWATYTVDANGRVIKELIGPYTIDYTYDEKGRLLERTSYDSESVVATSESSWEYDADGKLLRHVVYYDEKIFGLSVYRYDAQGKLVSVTYEEGGKPWSTTEYTYDEKGNLIQEVCIEDGSTDYQAVYAYTEDTVQKTVTTYYGETAEEVTCTYRQLQTAKPIKEHLKLKESDRLLPW